MKKFLIGVAIISGVSCNLFAAEAMQSAVDSHSCTLMRGNTNPFILSLVKGEKVQAAIERCANDAQLNGASLYGLGAVQPVTLRYFDHLKKVYQEKEVTDFMEVTNLTGNVTFINGKRQNHIHITLSDNNFRSMAGHLKDAQVGAILEIQIVPMPHRITKQHDVNIGLDKILTPR